MATNSTQNKLASSVQDAREAVTPAAGSAIDKIGAAAEQAIAAVQTNVLPALADAKVKLTPLVEDAKGAIVPVATEALAASKKQGRKAAEKMGMAEEPKKKHRVRKFLIALGIAGVAAFLYKKFTGNPEPTWVQSSPPSSGTSSSSTAPVDKSETAPTAPLASEETVESPVPTTPDEPLEEHQV